MRILVVEDDRKVSSFIRQGLEEEGHAVPRLVADVHVGNEVPMVVVREGKDVRLTARIARLVEEAPSKIAETEGKGKLGGP